MEDPELAAMFDMPSPPRAPRRAVSRSRSRSSSAGPDPGESSTAARPAQAQAQGGASTSYRDHRPNVSASKSRQAALALLDDWDADAGAADGADEGGAGGSLSKRAIDDPMDFNADEGIKKRRVIPKIDSARLLSDAGLPALLKKAQVFHVRGKGHEAKDLDNLLGMYQLWAHGMFPKATFRDTVARIEKVCHQRDLQGRLGQWKQEDRDRRARLLRGSASPSASPEVEAREPSAAVQDGRAGSAGSEERAASSPAVQQTENDDDDMDEDALIAAAEADLAALLEDEAAATGQGSVPAPTQGTSGPPPRQRLFADPDDDEEDFAALEAMAEMEDMGGM